MQKTELLKEITPGSIPSDIHQEILEEKIEKLKLICDQLDPYSPISDDLKEKLAEFQITDLYDPFMVTNKLLMLMEDSLELLEKLKK